MLLVKMSGIQGVKTVQATAVPVKGGAGFYSL